MRISTDHLDSCAVIHLAGEFGTLDCPAFLEAVDGVLNGGKADVVVNLRLTKYINSTALGAIITASKSTEARGGKLVISRPSSVCRAAVTGVGLDQIVPIFDNDDLAVQGLAQGDTETDPELEAAGPVGDEDSTVLFTPADSHHLGRFIDRGPRAKRSWHGVGHIAEIDPARLRFHWDGGSTGMDSTQMAALLDVGVDLRVKFRLPLLQRGYHEALVTIVDSTPEADGVRVTANYKQIDADSAQAVKQYATDMSFLKNELTRSLERGE